MSRHDEEEEDDDDDCGSVAFVDSLSRGVVALFAGEEVMEILKLQTTTTRNAFLSLVPIVGDIVVGLLLIDMVFFSPTNKRSMMIANKNKHKIEM